MVRKSIAEYMFFFLILGHTGIALVMIVRFLEILVLSTQGIQFKTANTK